MSENNNVQAGLLVNSMKLINLSWPQEGQTRTILNVNKEGE